MLFPKDKLHFNDAWQPAGPVRLGETMANLR
jgi:phosphatidylserine decarboxylase